METGNFKGGNLMDDEEKAEADMSLAFFEAQAEVLMKSKRLQNSDFAIRRRCTLTGLNWVTHGR